MATIAATKQAVIDQINAKAGTATSKDTIFLAKALKEASNAIDVGTNGQVLKTNAAATGVEWATDGGLPTGGSTGQVVTNTGSGTGNWQTPASSGADTALGNLTATGKNKVLTGWLDFNGTGTVAIRDHYNVSSIQDNGTGDYSINWATDFSSSSYSKSCTGIENYGSGGAVDRHIAFRRETPGAGASRILIMNSNFGTYTDMEGLYVMVTGDQ